MSSASGPRVSRAAATISSVRRMPSVPSSGPYGLGSLNPRKPQLPVPLQVEAGGVAGDPLLLRTAEQLVHRHPQALALGVPTAPSPRR